MRLKGKIALITGAGGGQGAAEVAALRRHGAFVYATDVSRSALQTVPGLDDDDGVQDLPLDVRSDAHWREAIEVVRRRHGRIDVLVNNAAITGPIRPMVDNGAQDVREVLDVNVIGVYLGIVHTAELMERGGSIVNIGSVDGVLGMPRLGPYVASKFAVRGLTRTAAIELGPRGIRVNTVLPGAIETPMLQSDPSAPDPRPYLSKRAPLGRIGLPEEVAELVVFLASDDSSFCTGGEYAVDGGWLA